MEDFVSAPWLRRLLTVTLLGGLVLLGFRVMEPFIVPVVWAAEQCHREQAAQPGCGDEVFHRAVLAQLRPAASETNMVRASSMQMLKVSVRRSARYAAGRWLPRECFS